MHNSLFYRLTYLSNQYVMIANAVSSNRIVIYWQLTMLVAIIVISLTPLSALTSYRPIHRLISAHCTAVAFLRFLTYYYVVADNVTAHM